MRVPAHMRELVTLKIVKLTALTPVEFLNLWYPKTLELHGAYWIYGWRERIIREGIYAPQGTLADQVDLRLECLKFMGRGYTYVNYFGLILSLRAAYPEHWLWTQPWEGYPEVYKGG